MHIGCFFLFDRFLFCVSFCFAHLSEAFSLPPSLSLPVCNFLSFPNLVFLLVSPFVSVIQGQHSSKSLPRVKAVSSSTKSSKLWVNSGLVCLRWVNSHRPRIYPQPGANLEGGNPSTLVNSLMCVAQVVCEFAGFTPFTLGDRLFIQVQFVIKPWISLLHFLRKNWPLPIRYVSILSHIDHSSSSRFVDPSGSHCVHFISIATLFWSAQIKSHFSLEYGPSAVFAILLRIHEAPFFRIYVWLSIHPRLSPCSNLFLFFFSYRNFYERNS